MLPRLIILLCLLAGLVRAHQIAEITMDLHADDGRFTATVRADAAYMLPEFRGDEDGAAPDLAWLRTAGPETWQRVRQESRAYLGECLTFSQPTEIHFPDFETDPPRFVTTGIPEMPPFIDVVFTGHAPGGLEITWREPQGVVLIVQAPGGVIPIVSGETAEVLQPREPGFPRWIRLGFLHILPAGLDHILFILGIFFIVPNWRRLIGLSLLFTLAHSLTLALAVLGWVALPDKPVEIIIAASIVWIGVEYFRKSERPCLRWAVVGVFGLVHGLGFARMLIPLIPADAPGALLSSLAGFNLGVELGQITVLAAAFALFAWLPDQHFRRVRQSGSLFIAAVGLIWLLGRLFNFALIPGT